jgi:hypothetical protein
MAMITITDMRTSFLVPLYGHTAQGDQEREEPSAQFPASRVPACTSAVAPGPAQALSAPDQAGTIASSALNITGGAVVD